MSAPTGLRIHSRAPTRIDLAGGTLDLWPLHLFFPGAATIHLGIDLWAETELEELVSSSPLSGMVVLRSIDQKVEYKFPLHKCLAAEPLVHALQFPPGLLLHAKLLEHFVKLASQRGTLNELSGIRLSTSAQSPAGAGLGGSSALAISMAGALRAWIERRELPNAREDSRALLLDEIELVRDIETTVIRVPAGAQDYYGAMFGGLEKITWGPARSSERFDYPTETLDGLGDRMLLFYSGTSRNSGINNWHLYKTLIDDTEKVSAVSEDFRQIVDATSKLHLALKQQNWKLIGEAIDQEFQARRHLAPGISTPEIDRALDLARKERNSTVGKICGAGGGGCFFLYTPEPWKPEQTALFRSRLTEIPGMLALDLKPAPLGREVRILSS